ncbi:GntR family transcriptional regulator [Pectobacterium sp. B1J-3]|uniref:GntR family transcriptional regulator n=1 Tax=Pectobacterium sp. B1J-3 TaxID=3385371 RepID=UPI0039064D91
MSGQFLPAERLIAQQLGLSRVTISRSMSLLEKKGLIVRQQGVGTRISQHLDDWSDPDEAGFIPLILRQEETTGERWLERERKKLPESIATEMSLPKDTLVTRLRRVHLMNGDPVSFEIEWIPLTLLPEPEQLDHSLYQYWATRNIYPEKKRYRLKALACPAEVAEHLHIPPDTPVLLTRQHTYDLHGDLLEYGEMYCRSDVYEFQVTERLASVE